MAIIRVDKTKGNYTQVSNLVCQDPKLTYKEKGMLLFLLSLPSDWNFSEDNILKANPLVRRDATRNIISSLKEKGYMAIAQEGLIWRWMIYEKPVTPIYGKGVNQEPENPEDLNATVSSKMNSKDQPPSSPHCTQSKKESKRPPREIKK